MGLYLKYRSQKAPIHVLENITGILKKNINSNQRYASSLLLTMGSHHK